MNKNWSLPEKQMARCNTIVSQYRKHFGYCLAPGQQYWSMSGLCDKPGCELDQVVSEGLITQEQFHGVEIVSATHARNVATYPEANWHNQDFYRALVQAKAKPGFNPAIINADLIQTAEDGAEYIARILSLLADHKDVMLVANFILRIRSYGPKDGEYVLGKLHRHHTYRYALERGWRFTGQYYQYSGTGRGNTIMGSFIFVS